MKHEAQGILAALKTEKHCPTPQIKSKQQQQQQQQQYSAGFLVLRRRAPWGVPLRWFHGQLPIQSKCAILSPQVQMGVGEKWVGYSSSRAATPGHQLSSYNVPKPLKTADIQLKRLHYSSYKPLHTVFSGVCQHQKTNHFYSRFINSCQQPATNLPATLPATLLVWQDRSKLGPSCSRACYAPRETRRLLQSIELSGVTRSNKRNGDIKRHLHAVLCH